MNKAVIYGLAAVVGVGAGVAVFSIGGDPDEPGPVELDLGRSSARQGSTSSAPDPGWEDDDEADAMAMTRTAPRRPTVDEDGKKLEPPDGNPHSEEQKALREQPFPQFTLRASPAWQNMALTLTELGHVDLSMECKELASNLSAARRDPQPDLEGLAQRQQELLAQIRGTVPGAEVEEIADRIESLMTDLDGRLAGE